MTRRDRIDGLTGAHLAAYDDTLQAGPRGLTLAELAPSHGHAAVAWLVRAGWLVEYAPGHYRAAAKEAVLALPDGPDGGGRMTDGGRPTADPKPETPAAPRAALRAPSACPQQPKKGQLALFGDLR